jgi:hypothetical protein
LRCLCGVAVASAVFASIGGLRQGAAVGWAVAALLLAGAFGICLALDDPVGTVVLVILAGGIGITINEWR